MAAIPVSTDLTRGFYVVEDGTSRFVAVPELADLFRADIQAILGRHHYSANQPYCGCSGLGGQRRHMCVYQRPNSRLLDLHRVRAAEHAQNCWRGQLPETVDAGPIYSEGVFKRNVPRESQSNYEFAGLGARQPSVPCYRFSRFAIHVMAAAQIDAVVNANSNWRQKGFRPFSVRQLLEAIDRELNAPRFASGSAYVTARAQLCEVRFGVIDETVAPCRTPVKLVNVRWWSQGALWSQLVVVDAETWNQALGSCVAFGHVQRAPYLCMATVEPDGVVRHLRLFPVATNRKTCGFTASRYESAFFSHLSDRQLCVLKPLLRTDAPDLIRRLSLFEFEENVWPLPDFVILSFRGRRVIVFVVELRGFEAGRFSEYDSDLGEKREFFSGISPFMEYAERQGWDYAVPNRSVKDDWSDFKLEWLGPTVAAQRVIESAAQLGQSRNDWDLAAESLRGADSAPTPATTDRSG